MSALEYRKKLMDVVANGDEAIVIKLFEAYEKAVAEEQDLADEQIGQVLTNMPPPPAPKITREELLESIKNNEEARAKGLAVSHDQMKRKVQQWRASRSV